MIETLSTDVLIVGAGAAGIRAAVSARKGDVGVVLVAADDVTHGGSTFSTISNGWGIQALVGRERTPENLEAFYNDIIRVGLNQSDPKLARILVEESGPAVEDLLAYGLEFKKDSKREYIRTRGCFSEAERAFITSNIDNLRQTFISILKRFAVRFVAGHTTDLIMDDGACRGAWIMLKSGGRLQISAKSTILATGGGAGIYHDNMINAGGAGDGYALGYLAGADCRNMEFIQFALGLKKKGTRSFLPTAELAQPDKVLDSAGRDILERCIPDEIHRTSSFQNRRKHMPFSCRDSSGVVDIAIAKALQSGKKIYWQNGCPEHDRFEVAHFAHAFNGGIKINEKGESSVPGLYAAGEVAAGAHGADRIGGCMMTATQVFGKRAGRYSAKRAKRINGNGRHVYKTERPVDCGRTRTSDDALRALAAIENRGKDAVTKYAAVLRSKKGLKKCLKILQNCAVQLSALETLGLGNFKQYYKVRNQLITANLVTESALARTESRGSHYREDDKNRKLVSS